MSPKIFALQEREETRIKMLDAGFNLIKEFGMTHASVEKIMKSVGLGKSTFYNFFPSKEMFVYEIVKYQRDQSKQHFIDILGERDKMTSNEAKDYLKLIIFSPNSIYQYLTIDDEAKLKAALPAEYLINPESEKNVMSGLFSHIEGIRNDIDFKIIANIIKIMAFAVMNQEALHKEALKPTLDRMYDLLFDCIFEEDS